MTVAGEVRQVSADIISLAGDTGRGGQPQWKVSIRWPWTPSANKGGDTVWIDRADVPSWDVDTRGRVAVEVQAESIRQGKDKEGNPWDGRLDWQWRWRILRVLDHAPAAPSGNAPRAGAASPEAYPYAAQGDARQKQIAWNSAVNNAVAIVAGELASGRDTADDRMDIEQATIFHAGWIYNLIIAGPPTENAQDAPEVAQPAAGASQTPQTPANAADGQKPLLRPRTAREQILAAVNEYKPDMQLLRMYVLAKYGRSSEDLTPDEGLAVSALIAQERLPEALNDLQVADNAAAQDQETGEE